MRKSMESMNNQSNLNSFQIISCRSATYYVISEQTPAAFSRTPQGRPQAGSRHSRKDEHRQSKSLYQSPFSIPYATISLLCHLRESRYLHNNQHPKQFTPTKQARSRTFCRHAPPDTPKTSLHSNRRPKTPGISSNQFGGCRAGKFGEMREVWRGKDTLRKGVLPPPRSCSSPPRSPPPTPILSP